MSTKTDKPTIWILNHYAGAMWESCSGRHHWFASRLIERGYQVAIFCANTCYGRVGTYHDLESERMKIAPSADGVEYIFVKCAEYAGNGLGRIRNMTSFHRNVKKSLLEYARDHSRPDVILASSVHPLTLVAGESIAKKWNVPCICEVRDLWPETFFYAGTLQENSIIGRLLVRGERWIYERAQALIFLKPGDPSYITEHGWNKESGGRIDLARCFYINNGIDLTAFDWRAKNEIIEDADLTDGCNLFVYAGTINKTNSVSNLVDAALLLRDRSDIRILVYGSGVDLEPLRARVAEEKLTNIVFKGYINRINIPYVLTQARASILNYSATGYNWSRGNSSNKLFEYMAAGRPVISSVKMAFSPVEDFACGISLEVSDAEHLARAISLISDMPEDEYNEMSDRARMGSIEYDYELLTDKLETVLDAVLQDWKEGRRA